MAVEVDVLWADVSRSDVCVCGPNVELGSVYDVGVMYA